MTQLSSLFIIFFIQSWTFAFPELGVDFFREEILLRAKRQSGDSDDKVTSTDLCTEDQFQEFVSDWDVCYTNAITKFLDEYVWDGDDQENERVTCNRYLDQSKCFTEGGPQGLKCWEDEEAKGRKLNYLYKNHQAITVNGTSEEGKLFIDSCIAFSNFENDYVDFTTGCPRCCSFEEYQNKRKEWTNCLDETLLKVEQRRKIAFGIGGAAGKNFLYRAECQLKKDWTETCPAFLSSCFNPNSSELKEFSFQDQFKQKEVTLQQYFDDFSYDSTCANI